MEVFYKLILSINSTSLLLIIYAVNNYDTLALKNYLHIGCFTLIACLLCIVFTFVCLFISRCLGDDDISNPVINIEEANNQFLPSYLGYFFVGLSISNFRTLFFIYVVIVAFTYFSQSHYFNPLFLFFGYKFYYITTSSHIRIFILSKKKIRTTRGLIFTSLKRINDTTFIDVEDRSI